MKRLIVLLAATFFSLAAFGQNTVFTATSVAIGDTVELRARSTVSTTLEVDWGDGIRVPFQVDSAISSLWGTISGAGQIKVYGDAEKLWVFSLYSAGLTEADVTALTNVYCLGLGDNNLTSIDLSKNLEIGELTLSGNPMESVDVSMLEDLYSLTLSRMENMKQVDVSKNAKLENLYVFNSPLESLDVSQNPELWDLQCSNCGLKSLDLSQNPKMIQLMCENNELQELDISACPEMVYLRCFNNYLTIGSLPLFHPIVSTSYLYAPQNPLPMEDTVGGLDLSAGYDCEGYITRYTWRTEEGRTLINGIDYTMTDGIVNFLVPGLKVSGQMENDFFPDLTGEDACRTEFFITGIGDVENEETVLQGTRVWAEGKTLRMESGTRVHVDILDMQGRGLRRLEFAGKTEWEAPVGGLYVVRMESGKASVVHKVMVL